MAAYRERLWVPVAWWLLGTLIILLLGPELGAVLIIRLGPHAGWPAALASFAAVLAAYAAVLVLWGRARIEVAGGELRAGKRRLPLAAAGAVAELDEAQSRALRGPHADPAAFLLMRPYLRRHVYVEVTGGATGTPYWLIATRHPAELAAAIERARPAAPAGGIPWDDRPAGQGGPACQTNPGPGPGPPRP